MVGRLRELLTKATPELVNGTASAKTIEQLLRAGCLGQRPRARKEPNYADDAALIAETFAALPSLLTALDQAVEALVSARQFIVNGVELGFIRLPDASTPDPAHDTLPLIERTLQSIEGKTNVE
jgi:hypothetical protein